MFQKLSTKKRKPGPNRKQGCPGGRAVIEQLKSLGGGERKECPLGRSRKNNNGGKGQKQQNQTAARGKRAWAPETDQKGGKLKRIRGETFKMDLQSPPRRGPIIPPHKMGECLAVVVGKGNPDR